MIISISIMIIIGGYGIALIMKRHDDTIDRIINNKKIIYNDDLFPMDLELLAWADQWNTNLFHIPYFDFFRRSGMERLIEIQKRLF